MTIKRLFCIYGHNLQIDYIRELGTLVIARISQLRGKLNARANKTYLVGYGAPPLIYRVYDPKDNSIKDTRNYKVYNESSYKENRLPREMVSEETLFLLLKKRILQANVDYGVVNVRFC
jgi:hypothetical protein